MKFVNALFLLSLGFGLLGIGPSWLLMVAGVCAIVLGVVSLL